MGILLRTRQQNRTVVMFKRCTASTHSDRWFSYAVQSREANVVTVVQRFWQFQRKLDDCNMQYMWKMIALKFGADRPSWSLVFCIADRLILVSLFYFIENVWILKLEFKFLFYFLFFLVFRIWYDLPPTDDMGMFLDCLFSSRQNAHFLERKLLRSELLTSHLLYELDLWHALVGSSDWFMDWNMTGWISELLMCDLGTRN